MFCNQCGSKIEDEAVFCAHCGTRIVRSNAQPTYVAPTPPQAAQAAPSRCDCGNCAKPKNENAVGLVGFILSFFVPLAGLICSIIGYVNAKKGAPNRGLSIAGIVISAISVAIEAIVVFWWVFVWFISVFIWL